MSYGHRRAVLYAILRGGRATSKHRVTVRDYGGVPAFRRFCLTGEIEKRRGKVGMKCAVRPGWRLVAWLVGALLGVVGLPVSAGAEEVAPLGGSVSLSGAPLVIEALQPLTGGEQVMAQEEARLASPEAVAEREASRTKYESLNRTSAVALAELVFNVQKPSWTSPVGEDGDHLTSYVGESSAAETAPGGQHVLLQSSIPLRSAIGSGQLAPVSLALEEGADSFVPANPLAPLSISKSSPGALSFPTGVGVAPAQAGSPEPPVIDGHRVFYPGTAPSTDFMVEPVPRGAEMSWLLRSQASSQENDLVFSLPAGAVLQMSTNTPGAAEVVKEGQRLLEIPPAMAREADGASLPVSYTVVGDTLATHVNLSGSVAFPVLVDPLVYGYYGSANAADTFAGWQSASNCTCIADVNELVDIKTEMNAGTPLNDYGEWYIYAPGAGSTGGAGVTRVDIAGVEHEGPNQSALQAQIGATNGSNPVYTFNGTDPTQTKPALYNSDQSLHEVAMVFCAQGAGGYDGGAQPLCNEESYSGQYFQYATVAGPEAVQTLNYSELAYATVTYLDNTPPDKVAIHNLPSSWVASGPCCNVYISGHDQGVGLRAFRIEIPPGFLNEKGEPFFVQEYTCAANGFTGCPQSESSKNTINFSGIATGVYTLGVYAEDAAANIRQAEVGAKNEEELQGSKTDPKLYIDHTAPKFTSLGGALFEAKGGVIGSGNYELIVKAEDGSVSAPQSGVRLLKVFVDGTQVKEAATPCAEPIGIPPSGCYTLTSSWTMEGQKYGAGTHTIKVTAKDWVGNEASESFGVTINESSYQPLGPGAVSLKTGDYKLGTTDVAIGAAGAQLALTRSYDSRLPTQGSGGPLGPQWSLSLPDASANGVWQSLRVLPSGSVQATAVNGLMVTFAVSGSSFTSPAGYQTDVLTKTSSSPLEYRMTDAAGNATLFTRVSSSSEAEPLLAPSGVQQATGAGGLNKMTYTFTKTAEGITEPTRVLAPYPATLKCLVEHVEELVPGCRELTFNYATTTTAKGEAPSEWGDDVGHLTRVYFTAYNPTTKTMQTTTVAQYQYDIKGRLRAEWDPRISPALKTEYGYDGEGHVTALTPPGLESWAFTYGTIAEDSNAGRVLKAVQAPASLGLWSGESTKNSEIPSMSGSAVVGNRLAVSNGVWSGGVVAYAYQWNDCNAAGAECTPILGADNPNYTPTSADVGHALVARVTATNGGGSTTASTAASSVVTSSLVVEYPLASGFTSGGIAVGSDGDLWVNKVSIGNQFAKITTTGAVTEYVGVAENEPKWITNGPDGNLWFTAYNKAGIGKITTSGVVTKYTMESGICDQGITTGSDSNLWFTEACASPPKIAKSTTAGAITPYSLPTGSEPMRITSGSDGALWFTEQGTSKIGRTTTTGTITEYALPAGSKPLGITGGPDNNLWFTEPGTNKIGKITTSGTISEYALPAGSGPSGITKGPDGALWFTEQGTSKIGRITTTGTITEYALPSTGAHPSGIVTGPDNNLWFAEEGASKIGKLVTVPPQGEVRPPQPGFTVEYEVPLSGSGAPYAMYTHTCNPLTFCTTIWATDKWGQTDRPEQATAIIPPDKPLGWPAAKYEHATVYYLDAANRTVNVLSPFGGISTAEYDSHNNQVRTLSADNRTTALTEGTKSAEVAKQLDTQLSYNSEGTELTSTLGPEHKVKLPAGSEAQARKRVTYAYDENAPGGGPYRLITSTKEAALIAGLEEDARTTSDSYAGQNGLGWQLHAATSTTTDPAGSKLTHTTVYDPATGNVLETMMPASSPVPTNIPTYSGQFGSLGSGTGQVSNPWGMATDASGDVWVADTGNNRVEEFSPEGTYLRQWGTSGTGNGQFKSPEGIAIGQGYVWVSDTANNRIQQFTMEGAFVRAFGSAGSGNGQLSCPEGLRVNSKGEVLVADHCNNRIEEFSSEGTFIRTIGTAGSGNGQLSHPGDVAVDAKENVWVADTSNDRIEEFSPTGAYTRQFGTLGSGNGRLNTPWRLIMGPEENVWVTDSNNNRVEVFSQTGEYKEQFGTFGSGNGQMIKPAGTGFHNATVFVLDRENDRVQKWNAGATGNEGAHTSQIVYYTPGTEASVAACQNHPVWANLPCQTQLAKQPETGGLPALPVTTYTYNMWDEAEVTKSTSGTATRTETDTYDSAGRLTSKETVSTTGEALPKINYEYSSATGQLIKQSTGSGTEEKKMTSVYNTLGQLTSYTDADGGTATYEYEQEGDARLKHVNDGKGTQSFTYDETTGAVKELVDVPTGTFTASYDAEGNMTSEDYPNGMTASLTYDATGQPVSLKYKKTTHCTEEPSENCVWFKDGVVPSIHVQWISQTSTVNGGTSTQSYAYDATGRLTQVQNTPAGKTCTTRVYTYDMDGNRTGLATHPANAEGKCSNEGGTIEAHSYDTADRLLDAGTVYNAFGDIEGLSASDAGGTALTSHYYTDGQAENQTQGTQTVGYKLDPGRRIRETVSTGKITASEIQHYAGAGTTPSWSVEPSGNWTRYISGIGAGLGAIEHNGETPVLQLSNLHGDIVATAADSETATGLASTIGEASEYGVPATEAPPKYSWLGAHQVPTELPSGVSAMGARSYIPQLGRFLQPDPAPGGSANPYGYTYGNPLNETDLSGSETSGGLSAVGGTGEGVDLEGGVGIGAGAIMPPPVNAQIEAAFEANPPWDQATAGTEEYEEYEEALEEGEEWGEEYAAFGSRSNSQSSAHSPQPTQTEEDGVFFQELSDEGQLAEGGSLIPVVGGGCNAKWCQKERRKHGHYHIPRNNSGCRSGYRNPRTHQCGVNHGHGKNSIQNAACALAGAAAGEAGGPAVGVGVGWGCSEL